MKFSLHTFNSAPACCSADQASLPTNHLGGKVIVETDCNHTDKPFTVSHTHKKLFRLTLINNNGWPTPIGNLTPPNFTAYVTQYCGNMVYNTQGNQSHSELMLIDGGYVSFSGGTPYYHYYLTDHLGSNRVVMNKTTGATIQVNHYYPYGGLFANSTNVAGLYYKFNGKEIDHRYNLELTDFGARFYDALRASWLTMDPLCEKYYELSPYAMCRDNPITFIDPHGDTIVVAGNIGMFATSVYNAMPQGTKMSLQFSNGILNPESIPSSNDSFLSDLKEVAENSNMVEIHFGKRYQYNNVVGEVVEKNFSPVSDFVDTPEEIAALERMGLPHGKSVSGNAGVSLFPNSSVSGQISTNQNIQIHINSKSTVNHQSIGLAHELIHVKRYMRGQPHSHLSNSFNNYLYSRLESLYKRLGYDYVDY